MITCNAKKKLNTVPLRPSFFYFLIRVGVEHTSRAFHHQNSHNLNHEAACAMKKEANNTVAKDEKQHWTVRGATGFTTLSQALCSHVADLTAQRTAAEEKCRVLEALPLTEDRYKDLLLQTHVGHFVMREDVSRSEVVCEEEVAQSFLTQALFCREGKVCAR